VWAIWIDVVALWHCYQQALLVRTWIERQISWKVAALHHFEVVVWTAWLLLLLDLHLD
jgi:hypothetical protein